MLIGTNVFSLGRAGPIGAPFHRGGRALSRCHARLEVPSRSLVALVASTALLAVGILAPAAVAGSRPDLVQVAVSPTPSSVSAGARVTVRDTVRNRGRKAARPFVTGYYLSIDARKGSGDVRLGARNVKRLKSGKTSGGSTLLTVPPTLSPGGYSLLACADDAGKVKERKERNNCRGSELDVRAAGGPAAGPAGDGGAGSAGDSGGSSGGGAGGDSPGPGGGPQGPLSVTPQLATGRAVTQTIGRWGGTISATGADGTSFTLDIPEDALLGAEAITMTPVERIDGMPFSGGLGAAVQLEPDGLRLARPATLTIEPTRSLSPTELTPFAYRDDGQEFHMYPLVRDPTRVAFSLLHFSGYGTGSGTEEERATQMDNQPTAPEDARNQKLGDALRDERECQLAGSSCKSADELTELARAALAAEYPSVVATLDAAATDDTRLEEGIGGAFGWIRSTQLYGLEDEFSGESAALNGKIWTAVKAAYERAYERCKQFDAAAPMRMLALLRLQQLLGRSELDSSKVDRCLSFKFSFQSDLTLTNSETGMRQSASVTLSNIDIKPFWLHGPGGSCANNDPCGEGSAPIGNWEFVPSSTETQTYALLEGSLFAKALVSRPDAPNLREGSNIGPPALKVYLLMPIPNEAVEATDAHGNKRGWSMNVFVDLLVRAHADEGARQTSSYGYFESVVSNGSRTYNRTLQLGTDVRLVESTTITVSPAPQ